MVISPNRLETADARFVTSGGDARAASTTGGAADSTGSAAPADSGATLSVALTGRLAQSLDYATPHYDRGRDSDYGNR